MANKSNPNKAAAQAQQSIVNLKAPAPASKAPGVVKNITSTIKKHLAGTPKQGMPAETANYCKFSKGK
jgi:hypothetical protein